MTIHGDTNSGNISMDLQTANTPNDGSLGAFEETISVLENASNYQPGPFIRGPILKLKSLGAKSAKAFTTIGDLAVATNPKQRLTEFNTTSKHGEEQ